MKPFRAGILIATLALATNGSAEPANTVEPAAAATDAASTVTSSASIAYAVAALLNDRGEVPGNWNGGRGWTTIPDHECPSGAASHSFDTRTTDARPIITQSRALPPLRLDANAGVDLTIRARARRYGVGTGGASQRYVATVPHSVAAAAPATGDDAGHVTLVNGRYDRSGSNDPKPVPLLVRTRADGHLDPRFGDDGLVVVDPHADSSGRDGSQASALVAADDGHLRMLLRNATGEQSLHIAGLTPFGERDATFGQDSLIRVAEPTDGRLLQTKIIKGIHLGAADANEPYFVLMYGHRSPYFTAHDRTVSFLAVSARTGEPLPDLTGKRFGFTSAPMAQARFDVWSAGIWVVAIFPDHFGHGVMNISSKGALTRFNGDGRASVGVSPINTLRLADVALDNRGDLFVAGSLNDTLTVAKLVTDPIDLTRQAHVDATWGQQGLTQLRDFRGAQGTTTFDQGFAAQLTRHPKRNGFLFVSGTGVLNTPCP